MLDIRPLNSELQKIANENLHETLDKVEDEVPALKDWIRNSAHLRARTDEQFLIAFLRFCHYDLEKAKEQIDAFYTLRTNIPEIIKDRNPVNSRLRSLIRIGFGLPLPYTATEGGPRYILIRPQVWNPNKYSMQDVFKVSTMINDIQLRCDDNWVVAGQVGILDLTGITREHLMQLNPDLVNKMIMLSQDTYPIRQQAFHYINAPKGFEQVFSVFLSCINDDNKSKIHMHGSDLESFYKMVPRHLMPREYGGDLYTINDVIREWEERIFYFRQYFEEEEQQFGVDESKRSSQALTPSKFFEVDDIENFLKGNTSGESSTWSRNDCQ
ncbi:unnamed protein product [Chironomus riparius]|uniref:CRAL-TRIO domain-containing protein n=1 Tax=Chironomus riparius TaxID=315576 RepID=A0A9N9S5G0_9DIPT|nr:unnamed protein product [Chironomus riparius]